MLGIITIILLFILTKFYLPLPGIVEYGFDFPIFYLVGMLIAVIIGLVFLSYFGIRFSGKIKKRSEALNKLQEEFNYTNSEYNHLGSRICRLVPYIIRSHCRKTQYRCNWIWFNNDCVWK